MQSIVADQSWGQKQLPVAGLMDEVKVEVEVEVQVEAQVEEDVKGSLCCQLKMLVILRSRPYPKHSLRDCPQQLAMSSSLQKAQLQCDISSGTSYV